MIDFTLSDEHRALQELARDFAERVVKPIVREREQIPDPRERLPIDIVEQGSRLGLRTLRVPQQYGGFGADTLGQCIVDEELAVADLSVASIFDQTSRLLCLLYEFATPDQRERLLAPVVADHRGLVAMAGSEPQSGSDNILPYDEPDGGIRTFAERRGTSYVLNGTKQMITLGSDAALYMVQARTDRSKRLSEGALTGFLVRRGTPGFRVGKIWDKMGQVLMTNADLILEGCEVPAEDVLLGEGQLLTIRRHFQRSAGSESGALVLGIGRAAYEAAVRYARDRVQGGKAIIDHQAVGMMLADMATRIEMGRALIWKAAWSADYAEQFDPRLPSMAKIVGSETAFDVARLALEIHGGSGIMKDLPVERYLRDASTVFHLDGTNQIHRLRVLRWIKEGF
ncbi:MAG: acyl-CoA dehydrogenase family protein [Chloroflexi bacterium]|nr:acyl-CoA dehydrogenase family protein [Chloroflexota bacterium]